MKRDDQGEFWWGLRSCSYMNEFFKPKIVYPCIMATEPHFAYDENQNFTPAPGNIITGEHIHYLLGLLCSKTYYFALRKYYMGGGIEGKLKTNRLLLLPLPKFNTFNQGDELVLLVKQILNEKDEYKIKKIEDKIEKIIFDYLEFT